MTDDQLLALCLDADPVDYWADVSSWRPPYVTEPQRGFESPTILRVSVIPPIAGGSPGLVTDIMNAIKSWVWGGIIKPVINWLLENLFSLSRDVGAYLGTFVSRVVGFLWRWWYNLWKGLWRPEFGPAIDPAWLTGSPPLGILLASLFQYPALAVLSRVLDWVYWIRDRIVDARAAVINFVQAAADVTRAVTNAARDTIGGWIAAARDNVKSWVTAARDTVGGWIAAARDNVKSWVTTVRDTIGGWIAAARDNVKSWVTTARDTIGAWITAARDWVVDHIFGAVVAGAQTLVGGLQDAFRFVADLLVDGFRALILGPVEETVALVNRKLAIPGKLVRGDYPNLLAFLDDIIDPAPAIVGTLFAPILLALVIAIVTSTIMSLLVQPLTEPHVQDIRAGVGAQLLPVQDIQEGLSRGIITEPHADDQLARTGYGDTNSQALKDLRYRLPGASDLIRFGVREVFTPDIAEKFGQFADFPSAFADMMELQGFGGPGAASVPGGVAPGGRSWAEAYWAAHWELPSVTQAFEMFHRRATGPTGTPMTLDDLKLLLRAQDVMPAWRQGLVDIAFTLPSRVDLRRMLRAGVIEESDVLQGYQFRGYDDFWARALTDFAVQWATPEDRSQIDDLSDASRTQIRLAYRRGVVDRDQALDLLIATGSTERLADFWLSIDDAALAVNPFGNADVDIRELTRADIIGAYRDGLWDRARAQSELEAQGYLPTSADVILSRVDLALARALTQAQVDLVRQQFVSFDLDDTHARTALDELGIPPTRQDLLLAEWAIDRQAGTRKLSLAQVRRARAQGLITDDDALVRVLRLGYNIDDAAILLA